MLGNYDNAGNSSLNSRAKSGVTIDSSEIRSKLLGKVQAQLSAPTFKRKFQVGVTRLYTPKRDIVPYPPKFEMPQL